MRIIRFLIVILLMISLVACADKKDEASTAFDAKAFTETLLAGDAASLYSTYSFTDEMIAALGDDGLVLLKSQLEALGELESVGEAKVSESSSYTVYSVPCIHSYQNFDLVISIDADGKIAGIVMGNYSGEEVADLSFLNSQEVTFGNALKIEGTLTLPKDEDSYPCVIFLGGSGPSDRDETIGPNKPFKDLALGLAQRGIASLRFDKRTYLYPEECANDLDFTLADEIVDDAIAAYEFIKERKDISAVYILGHSLGGQVLPLVAKEVEADGYIYLAAPARDFLTLLKEQLAFLSDFETGGVLDTYYDDIERLEDRTFADDELVLGAYKTYWEDLLSYDQIKESKKIKAPQLFLQGEEDYQVTISDFEIWQENIPNATFISYPNLNHIFTEGSKSEGPDSYLRKATFSEEVIDDIAAFIKDNTE